MTNATCVAGWLQCSNKSPAVVLARCQKMRRGHQLLLLRCRLPGCRLPVSFLWPSAKLPSSRQRENKTDPLPPSPPFLTSLKFPQHQHNWKEKRQAAFIGKTRPRRHCRAVDLQLVLLFSSVWFYTLTSYIPFVKITS